MDVRSVTRVVWWDLRHGVHDAINQSVVFLDAWGDIDGFACRGTYSALADRTFQGDGAWRLGADSR